MKKIIFLFLLLCNNLSFAISQSCGSSFDRSRPCQINVNTNYPNFNIRNDVKRATVRYTLEGGGSCTGTLLNTTTNKQIFITAAHCLKDGINCSGNIRPTYQDAVNHGLKFTFVFNYQSPNGGTWDTPLSNRGCGFEASNNTTVIDGYEYFHQSYVKLLYFTQAFGGFTDCIVAGDVAVFEILTPIPPHFNVYYAGWSPEFFNKPPFAVIHHPATDIKKISEMNGVSESGTALACHTVTSVIDWLFGWIWGESVVTNVVCNYLEAQQYSTAVNLGGGVQGGSSGVGFI